ncbi:MAG: VWA domain-containing protein [Fimbriimonadaceae bacterium]|nr:VWA domain-containing protein [Fimbriimonadaceae bacterium]
MRFVTPLYLLLLVPAVAGLWISFRHVHGMAKARKRLAFALRFLLAACLILALAGPQLHRPYEGVATIFLLDRSDSVSDRDRNRAAEFADRALSALGPNDVGGVIAFGKDAVIEAAPGGRRKLGKIASVVDGSASDLAAAVRLAAASFPEGHSRRVVVLSDGNETDGDLVEAADVAATDGIELDYVLLGQTERTGEATVLDLEAPSDVRADQPFDLRILAESSTNQRAILTLDRDGQMIHRVAVSLTKGKNAVVLSDKLARPGFFRYRATLTAERDTDIRNNVGAGFVAVRGRPRILVLQSDLRHTHLVDAVRKQGLDVDLGGPGQVPVRPEEFQRYDAIVFNDLNAASLTPGQMKALESTVKDTGVGFAMIGGENSFLPGGYYGTPVADALPVDLNIRQRKSFPSTSILIVVDASGSMSMVEDGFEKIRLAGMAAEQTVRLLSPLDRVGVAGSTDNIQFVAPMQKLDDKERVISQIRKLGVGGGGVYAEPSSQFAAKSLRAEGSKVRHFIFLADGADVDLYGASLNIVDQMRREKITTSVVAIGDGKDVPFLKQMAAAGGGRFYLAKRAGQLPAIFTQDAAVMSRSAIEEGAFFPKVGYGEDALRGIAPNAIPALYAYCLTDRRPLARTGMRTHKDDPLLATWQYGLGSSLAFTSDAQARWAAQWVSWDGFGRFWSQALRAIGRRTTRNDYRVAVRQEGGDNVVEIKAFDSLGNPLPALEGEVRLGAPQGESRALNLTQQAPGVFQGRFRASRLGTYTVTVSEPGTDGKPAVRSAGFSVAYPPEYRSYRANERPLARAAQITGGRALAEPGDSFRPVSKSGASITDVWPWFVWAAALLLPLDVAMRRVALPFGELLAKLVALLRARRGRVPADVPQQATVARLQKARDRAAKPPQTAETERPAVRVEPSRPTPTPTRASTGESAASRLLEAKRNRDRE